MELGEFCGCPLLYGFSGRSEKVTRDGSSGGSVFNKDGEVIGVVSAMLTNPDKY